MGVGGYHLAWDRGDLIGKVLLAAISWPQLLLGLVRGGKSGRRADAFLTFTSNNYGIVGTASRGLCTWLAPLWALLFVYSAVAAIISFGIFWLAVPRGRMTAEQCEMASRYALRLLQAPDSAWSYAQEGRMKVESGSHTEALLLLMVAELRIRKGHKWSVVGHIGRAWEIADKLQERGGDLNQVSRILRGCAELYSRVGFGSRADSCRRRALRVAGPDQAAKLA